jgi:NAD(P)-dependent dehydrogenase (short-subunit alcohol dehydrogenase family)
MGIRVNAIAPGPIETSLVREMHTDRARTEWTAAVPQRRYGKPAEVAGAAIFLLGSALEFFDGRRRNGNPYEVKCTGC